MPASDEVPGSGEVAAGSQKRKFLKDMTPNSKEAEIERRKQAKRVNSNKWHATWASKGSEKKNVNQPNLQTAQWSPLAQPLALFSLLKRLMASNQSWI